MTISTSEPTPPASLLAIKDEIRAEALKLGFSVCGFASATEAWPNGEWLREFVQAERHGAMGWMEETLERRSHPTAMWTDAKSAVVLGVNYGPDIDPLEQLADPARAAISVYAQGDDYHDVIKKRLKVLAGWMHRRFGQEVKVFVDTAPLLEKPLAQRAGLGWQGKHTNLVSRQFGSWLFLGSVLTTLDLPADDAEVDHCGSCRACLDVCPTNAFPAPRQLDARRCISYLTIELSGPIPAEFRPALGNRIYGCDDCLAVCPWNKFASLSNEAKLVAREALRQPSLAELAVLDDAAFRALFSKNPIKRIGRDRFVRNVLYAIGNSGDAGLMDVVEPLLDDPAPVVRGAAVWAARRLLGDAARALRGPDSHPDVLAEWQILPPAGEVSPQATEGEVAG
ncbi:tRNA epoxyqueuosine(34) reductase QueG [Caulobacter vibrioides]|uniref:tRNA epoxyqueuosine(34) reductase QueG n=1 Tax=Caulobacter vibrioides TaxID=155892 RepID=UPI000BB47501|nr:tRNA epoxyqueuosine(34) reductase QueG [Caulobacter vibrioides]ATC26533.1 tRNA epoxyqueuosine(34) reductase QueG [Caulobacter vibrioides]AZH14617.1 tRNA epoxyqueuosine(34) reductase QueG [Caulobacter vibrioides]PLR12357.1 tRNA epoxyqueuosine(34) reductase QueG [Caulobacter vibrioides]